MASLGQGAAAAAAAAAAMQVLVAPAARVLRTRGLRYGPKQKDTKFR